ncbi:hypothetical protein ACFQV2_04220 [Actinokineospora soli]|uniref:Uncharacterized protein n=1 Tax=Actinokineospora soli TaxID=1048753 RepID=A0ABW2THH8_9PSEU
MITTIAAPARRAPADTTTPTTATAAPTSSGTAIEAIRSAREPPSPENRSVKGSPVAATPPRHGWNTP